MTPDDLDDLTLAAFLVGLAGFVDAVGFLILGGVFVSFMSGNSTQFAIRTGQELWSGAAPAGAMVAMFVAGVVGGRLSANASGRWRRPAILTLEAGLLGVAAFAPAPALAAGALMSFAMGAQNGILHAAGRTVTSLTYVTGSLVKFGEGLADALLGAGPISVSWPYLALWAAMVAGGVTGAVAFGELGLSALVLPALAAALLAAASAAGFGRRPTGNQAPEARPAGAISREENH